MTPFYPMDQRTLPKKARIAGNGSRGERFLYFVKKWRASVSIHDLEPIVWPRIHRLIVTYLFASPPWRVTKCTALFFQARMLDRIPSLSGKPFTHPFPYPAGPPARIFPSGIGTLFSAYPGWQNRIG